MGKIARLAVASLLFFAACADDEFAPPPPAIDAAQVDTPMIDTPTCVDCDGGPTDAPAIDATVDAPSSVQVISCTGLTPAAIIAASNFMFTPQNTTISVNGVIQVTATGSHTFTSDTGLFDATIGNDTCVRFTAAGSFPFHCSIHSSMTGTVTVQ
jgi:plastocyanin